MSSHNENRSADDLSANESHGALTEPGTIVFQRLLPGPIERVWEFLTDPEKRGKWLASGEMELEVGGRVELIFNNNDLSPGAEPPEKYREYGGCVSFTGRITRLESPFLLAYTWAGNRGEDSEVTFELTPQDDGRVRLLLTHRRLGDDHDVLVGAASGWHTHLDILIDRLEGRTSRPFWEAHSGYERKYAERLS